MVKLFLVAQICLIQVYRVEIFNVESMRVTHVKYSGNTGTSLNVTKDDNQ